MGQFRIFELLKLLLLSIFFLNTNAREWDCLVQEYFPKSCKSNDVFGIRSSRFENSPVNAASITQADFNLCLKQGERLARILAQMDDSSKGEEFPSITMKNFFTAKHSPEAHIALKNSKATLLASKILQNKLTTCGQMTPNTFVAFLEAKELKNPKISRLLGCPSRCSERSLDGSCNNLYRPTWGAANTPFARIAPEDYGDGLYSMPVARSGNLLPSARKISSQLFRDRKTKSYVLTNMAVHWGQIVAHDLSMRIMEQCGSEGIQCCKADGSKALDESESHSACAPILVPPDDPFYSCFGIQCLNYVRSATMTPIDGSLRPAQQINTVSSFLDASPIYSVRASITGTLRTYRGGKLHVTNKNLLPFSYAQTCESVSQSPCYKTGDPRVNQTPSLVALQTLLTREHNRIAKSLSCINRHWNDEKLFQESRKILTAQVQHITYQEWLPLIIGKEYVYHHGISPIGLFSYDYDSNTNPSIINSFANGAFRYFHTLVAGDFLMCFDENQEGSRLRLSDHFLKPNILELYEGSLDAILRGSVIQSAMEADTSFSAEITNFLFKSINNTGMDLAAMDIQRGRDHGLGKYNVFRTICGLKKANTFEDLLSEIPKSRVEALKLLYEHVDDIDLFVGGTMESDVYSSLLGPTFQCIIGEQFYRTRVGDRYFYDIGEMAHSFTPDQMREIKKTSIARIICENSNIRFIQPKAFELVNANNSVCECEFLPSINFEYWRER